MDGEQARELDEGIDPRAVQLPASSRRRDEATVVMRKRARSQPMPMTHGITAVLTIVKGRNTGQTLVLHSGDNLVGRAREADILVDDVGVSRRHVRLNVDVRGRVDLLDLDSTNGTFVNGERVTSESLRVGDRIRVGLEAVLELGQRREDRPVPMLVHEQDAPTVRRNLSVSPPPPRGPETPTLGDSEEILGYARLLEIRRRRMGDGHASVAELLEKIGLALRTSGQVERASQCLTRALAIHQSREPPAPRATARLLGQLAECDLMLDRPHAVVPRLEQAERLLRTTLATAAELGGVRLLLSQVLWRLGQHERSTALARLAQQALASGGSGSASSLHHGARAWMQSIATETVDDRDL
jgi:hypothetical protein